MGGEYISKRQALLHLGFNAKTFDEMVAEGLVQVLVKAGKRPSVQVSVESLESLAEGEHYVVCQECGAFQNQITTKHLRSCSSLVLATYRDKYPEALVLSAFSSRRKAKTKGQRQRQSSTLKRRFQTPEGEKTREQIRAASRRLMETDYKERASEHLRALGQDPEVCEARSVSASEMWADPAHQAKVKDWHKENRSLSLEGAAHARGFLTHTFSKLHQKFKMGLEAAGASNFETEHPVEFYRIDEADPALRIALEVDGCYWHGCSTCGFDPQPGMAALDKRKTTYLTNRGWVVLRFPEHQIHADLEGCLAQVFATMEKARAHK